MPPPANTALARQLGVLTVLVLWHGYYRVGGELGLNAWKTTTGTKFSASSFGLAYMISTHLLIHALNYGLPALELLNLTSRD
jgi:hypothetical protein